MKRYGITLETCKSLESIQDRLLAFKNIELDDVYKVRLLLYGRDQEGRYRRLMELVEVRWGDPIPRDPQVYGDLLEMFSIQREINALTEKRDAIKERIADEIK